MPDEQGEDKSADAIARKLVAQCRNDIKAAWDQLEAARGALAHSRWLRSRWEAQAAVPDAGQEPAADDGSGPSAVAPPAKGYRRRRRRRAKRKRS